VLARCCVLRVAAYAPSEASVRDEAALGDATCLKGPVMLLLRMSLRSEGTDAWGRSVGRRCRRMHGHMLSVSTAAGFGLGERMDEKTALNLQDVQSVPLLQHSQGGRANGDNAEHVSRPEVAAAERNSGWSWPQRQRQCPRPADNNCDDVKPLETFSPKQEN
jgi:hypothetical protein